MLYKLKKRERGILLFVFQLKILKLKNKKKIMITSCCEEDNVVCTTTTLRRGISSRQFYLDSLTLNSNREKSWSWSCELWKKTREQKNYFARKKTFKLQEVKFVNTYEPKTGYLNWHLWNHWTTQTLSPIFSFDHWW